MNSPNTHSKPSDEYGTPWYIIENLEVEFGPFDLDVCCSEDNCKAHNGFFSDNDEDGLKEDWSDDGRDVLCWMNPPYSRGNLRRWLTKAIEESQKPGVTVVALIPSDTSTSWWDLVWDRSNHEPQKGMEIRFVDHRISFEGAKWPAKFGSAIVIMWGK